MALLLTLIAAQVVAAGPPAPPRPKVAAAPAQTCITATLTEPGVIVVCAERPQGYRLDPDVTRAKKEARNHTLPKDRELLRDSACKSVGPAGCMNQPAINVVGAVGTAVAMVRTAMSGGNVGKMFVSDPQMSEYDYYLAAKQEREEAAEQAADQAAVAAAGHSEPSAAK
ncbi:hypothetical protein OMW55_08385 [Sphingomonas sp. BN140010]|uniref:Secreted protein n=1 Tax=Sphingomonas arvum TaxID=2992113 RepID=A0ABT3JFN6_9SPHN|nr:hypothetical protein [Sphingomonas sp. BN140010]MCW3797819.1 hypothetical protein [Sphingomonas sp. BN140010]